MQKIIMDVPAGNGYSKSAATALCGGGEGEKTHPQLARQRIDVGCAATEAAAGHRALAASALGEGGTTMYNASGFAGRTFLSSLPPPPNSEPMEPKKPFFCSVRYPIEIPGEISSAAFDLCRSPAHSLP